MMPRGGHLTLPFGTFYGMVDRRVRAPGLDLALLSVDPHRVVERHSHDEAHFVFVLDGLYVSSADGAPPVSAGHALIFNPAGTTHRDRFEARNHVMSGQFLTLSVSHEMLAASAAEGAIHSRAVALRAPAAVRIASRLAAACVSGNGETTIERESLALALLEEVSIARRGEPHDAPAWLARARTMLDDAVGGNIGIGEVAHEAGVHPVHLARVFRRCLGVSPGEYLRTRRLAHAGVLLRETSRSLSEVALVCGFADQSHLATAFRRAYGVTPRQYRGH